MPLLNILDIVNYLKLYSQQVGTIFWKYDSESVWIEKNKLIMNRKRHYELIK